jgi:hypothetical protein
MLPNPQTPTPAERPPPPLLIGVLLSRENVCSQFNPMGGNIAQGSDLVLGQVTAYLGYNAEETEVPAAAKTVDISASAKERKVRTTTGSN